MCYYNLKLNSCYVVLSMVFTEWVWFSQSNTLLMLGRSQRWHTCYFSIYSNLVTNNKVRLKNKPVSKSIESIHKFTNYKYQVRLTKNCLTYSYEYLPIHRYVYPRMLIKIRAEMKSTRAAWRWDEGHRLQYN